MSRKPFEIGDKVIRISGNKNVFTVIGKTLSGQPLVQMGRHAAVMPMYDPSEWEHYVKPVTSYVNIFSSGEAMVYMSKRHADADPEGCEGFRVACVKITYREGQFDD